MTESLGTRIKALRKARGLTLYPGDSVFIPEGAMHSARKMGEEPCESNWIKAV